MTREFFGWLAIWLVLLVLLLLWSAGKDSARAHDWYEQECCHDKDCRSAIEGEVVITKDGYYVTPARMTLAFKDQRVRRSKDPADPNIHVCLDPQPYGAPPRVRCIYTPFEGF